MLIDRRCKSLDIFRNHLCAKFVYMIIMDYLCTNRNFVIVWQDLLKRLQYFSEATHVGLRNV